MFLSLLPFLTPLSDNFLTPDRNCGFSAYDRLNLTQFHYQINGKIKSGPLCRRYEVMDWAMILKRRQSWCHTACGYTPHMTYSPAPPPEAGSSSIAHAQNSHFHYQTTTTKLKNEQSNLNPCPAPVIARSASDEAISTNHPEKYFSKHNPDPFSLRPITLSHNTIHRSPTRSNSSFVVPQPFRIGISLCIRHCENRPRPCNPPFLSLRGAHATKQSPPYNFTTKPLPLNLKMSNRTQICDANVSRPAVSILHHPPRKKIENAKQTHFRKAEPMT